MQRDGANFEIRRQGEAVVIAAAGCWVVSAAGGLDRALKRLDGLPSGGRLRFDLSGIEMIDTAGAWLVLRTCRALEARGIPATIENLAPDFAPLLDQVARGKVPPPPPRPPRSFAQRLQLMLEGLGARTIAEFFAARELIGFFGLVVVTWWRALRHPRRIRMIPLTVQVERTGVTALPIVGMLSLLIGVVIAFQGADQLRQFGADIFTVNLLGIGILRELGGLLTAIIAAGRSGSAFTAEIGAMEVNEEIDAMRTLGLDPIEILVLPRLFGLIIALPLLTAYADFMGLLGGAIMAWATLNVPFPLFVRQLHDAIGEWTFWVGMMKAPFFAATIALVGCHAGMQVSRSAESVGRLTTMSVVRSIFLVIVIDAAFSIVFVRLGI